VTTWWIQQESLFVKNSGTALAENAPPSRKEEKRKTVLLKLTGAAFVEKNNCWCLDRDCAGYEKPTQCLKVKSCNSIESVLPGRSEVVALLKETKLSD
jgi:hypothetical protein